MSRVGIGVSKSTALVTSCRSGHGGAGETAVSRAYYASYHAVVELIEVRAGVRRRSWNHMQVQNDFRTLFGQRGFLFTIRDVSDLQQLYQARLTADYEQTPTRQRQSIDFVLRAKRLCNKIIEELGRA
jgi:uncharacterized protein (UPF0332 family)